LPATIFCAGIKGTLRPCDVQHRNDQPSGWRALPPDRPPLEGRLTFRVREVIELTGLSQSTIYEMMDEGQLASTKVRGIRLIYADSLRNVLALATP
jgi:excisionase family DNA binding protein